MSYAEIMLVVSEQKEVIFILTGLRPFALLLLLAKYTFSWNSLYFKEKNNAL